jgi:putative Ca2+/H+ antiporter (TMEM165/GDT1 family)
MNFWPLITALFIIAAAELGDKTQLLTLTFATRYPVWKVISAVSAATAVLMGLAVFLGGIINRFIPEFYLQLIAGAVFILFGLWIIFGREKEEEAKADKNKNPFLIVFATFFLAELGDKTQLATLALSAKYGTPFQVWLGATLGMAGINTIAALAGSWIKRFVSEKMIKWLGAAVFILFGLITLVNLFANMLT